VSVRIPQDSERSGLVRIEGDPKGVQLARRELLEMVQRMVCSLRHPRVPPLALLLLKQMGQKQRWMLRFEFGQNNVCKNN